MPNQEFDLAPRAGQTLFGDSSTPLGSPSAIGRFRVLHSGESILFEPLDSRRQPLPIVQTRNLDDVQLLTLVGSAEATDFSLQYADEVTNPIPLVDSPPLTSFSWLATLPQSGDFDLALAWGHPDDSKFGPCCQQALLEVFDGDQRIGSIALDQTNFPDPTTDIAVSGIGIFRSFGTFSFSSKSMELRLSGTVGTGLLAAGMLRLVPHGSTTVADVGYIDPSPNRAGNSNRALEGQSSTTFYGNWTLSFYYTKVANYHGVYLASPTGTQITRFPTLAGLQSALRALHALSSQNVEVTASSNQQFKIHFTGELSGQACPTLLSTEPTLRITHDGSQTSSVGGQFPLVTINGVSFPLGAASFASNQPYALFHLIQDAPDVQYLSYRDGLFQSGYYQVVTGQGFRGIVTRPTQPGPVATWRFEGLPGDAEYQVDITWPPDPNADQMDCLIQDGYGNTLATISGIDQTQSPADSFDGAFGWKTLARFTLRPRNNSLVITANNHGSPGKFLQIDTVRLTRVSARRSTRIEPGDSVLFSATSGFVETSAGPIATADYLIVEPPTPTRMPPLPTTPKTMKLGTNCDSPTYYGTDSCFANLAIQLSAPLGLSQDNRGNPTRLAYNPGYQLGLSASILTQPFSDGGGKGLGGPNFPTGIWVVEWTGSPWNECHLDTQVATTTSVELTSRRVTGSVNRRFYQVSDLYYYAPGLQLRVTSSLRNTDGTYACDVANVAVYSPDVDPDHPPKWRPSFLEKIRGFQCFRFMDFFGTNHLNLARFEHFPDPLSFPLGYTNRKVVVPIESIGPPTPDLFVDNKSGTVVRVVTKRPHGLVTGFRVKLQTTDATSLGTVIGHVVDPRTNLTTNESRDPIDPTDGYQSQVRENFCHVIDETTLQIAIEVFYGPSARMVNTLNPTNGVLVANIAPGATLAPADAADLCLATNCEPWINVPWLADDDCVQGLAQVFADRIPRGKNLHVEYANEVWNYAFIGCYYSVFMNNLNGNPGFNFIPFYITRMSQIHEIFRRVWVSASRDPNEIRRVCGSQMDNPGGTTLPMIQYAIANQISFDEIAPACYYSNGPAAGPEDDLLTREQLLDLLGVNLQHSPLPGQFRQHSQAFTDALAQNPGLSWLRDVVVVNYEGGPEVMTTTTMSANVSSRNHGVHRHPDFCEIELYHLQLLEDAGVKLFNVFTLNNTNPTYQWGVYEGFPMQPGTGDATIDVANCEDFENLPVIKSEMAAALRKWSAMTVSLPRPRSAQRNGIPRSFGVPAF